MRKKTINLLIGVFIGLIIAIISSALVYYYFGVVRHNEISRQYQLLIEDIEKPEVVEVYKVEKNIKMDKAIDMSYLSKVEIPANLDSTSLIHDEEELLSMIANVDIKAGSLLYKEMCYSESELPNDLRLFELKGIVLPMKMKVGDYVDLRISFSSGLDFSVLSKKRVIDIIKVGESENFKEYTIFHLDTDEILRLKSAIVDAYINDGTYLYPTIYVAADRQKAAEITYPVNDYVQELISTDLNIVNKAMNELEKRNREIISKSLENLPPNIDWNREFESRKESSSHESDSILKNDITKKESVAND